MKAKTIWGIHMPKEHGLVPVEEGYVAIGWHEMGNLRDLKPTRDAFKAAYSRTYPTAKPGEIPVGAGLLYRFSVEMKTDDLIILPSKPDRMVNIGIIDSDYIYDPSMPLNRPNVRRVKWLKHIPRSSFSQSALNEIGSALTLFQVSSNSEEFLAALAGQELEPGSIDEANAERVAEQVEESAADFIIKRLKTAQSAYQFEHFVAHLLECMGYFARVTQASGDGGVDIIAHRDELGFEPPIIKVQCKQVLNTIDRPDVQKLFGSIEREEKGLFVTLGTFSAGARTFEQSKSNLRLIDGTALVELIYNHYEKFSPRYQSLIPLKRTFSPAL